VQCWGEHWPAALARGAPCRWASGEALGNGWGRIPVTRLDGELALAIVWAKMANTWEAHHAGQRALDNRESRLKAALSGE